jgi:hypothetical protein
VRLLTRQINALSAAPPSSQPAACLSTFPLLESLSTLLAAAGWGLQPSQQLLALRQALAAYIAGPAAACAVQVQRCMQLLQAETAAPHTTSGRPADLAAVMGTADGEPHAGHPGAEMPSSEYRVRLAAAVVRMQQSLLRLAGDVEIAAEQDMVQQMLAGSSIAEAALQLLCAYTHVLYEQHVTGQAARQQGSMQQQQQQQCAGDTSSTAASSSSGSTAAASNASSSYQVSCRRVLQCRRLPITPVHERLKLLPAAGKQLYLQAVRAVLQEQQQRGVPVTAAAFEALLGLVRHLGAAERLFAQMEDQVCGRAYNAAAAAAAAASEDPGATVAAALSAQASVVESKSPAVTAPAVLLVLQLLQLLAAELERHIGDDTLVADAVHVCSAVLSEQLILLVSSPSAGFSVRRSVVLRQSGQQLLQLLRWQVQHAAQKREESGGSRSDIRTSRGLLGDVLPQLMWIAGAWDSQATGSGRFGLL